MSTTAAEPHTFEGYLRSDGRVGVRNHLALVSTVALANRIAELAGSAYGARREALDPPALLVHGEFQRGLQAPDAQRLEQVLERLVLHPNVGAAVVLCHDRRTAQAWQARLQGCGKPVEVLAVMESLGVQRAIDRTADALARAAVALRGARRVACPLSALTYALECGGSDASSAICANPAIGRYVDEVVQHGARVIVSETAEFIGGEAVVRAQSQSPEVADDILRCIAATEARMAGDGDHYRGVNPTAENIEAGLTTLVEKTMGALCKIGTARFAGCLAFGEPPAVPGLHFMDTPFFSPCSITGMVAAGAQLTLFAMGVFNPSGNPLAPTIKVCGNPDTLRHWPDGIDVPLADLLEGRITLDAAAQRLGRVVREVAGGATTHTERWGEGQFIVPRMLPTF